VAHSEDDARPVSGGDAAPEGETGGGESAPAAPRFLRRKTWWAGLLAAAFLAGCACSVALWVLYRWPHVNGPVFFFTVRPAFAWYGALAPLFVAGAFGLRARWMWAGTALWLACLASTEETLQLLRPFPQRAREEFAFARKAYEGFAASNADGGTVLQIPLRIVCWNVAAGQIDGEAVARQLAEEEPDIALIQEYSWRPKVGIGAVLEKAPGLTEYHRMAGRQGILSRFPVTRLASPYLPPWRCSVYEVEVAPGRRIVCVNVHLSARKLRAQLLRGWTMDLLRDEARTVRSELEGLRKTVALYQDRAPVVVAGDFNLPAHFAGLNFLRETHKDAFAAGGFGWGKTVPNRWRGRRVTPVLRIDMVWVPRGSRVYYAGSVFTAASDHDMVLAEVAVPVPGTAASSAVKRGD